MYNNNSTIIVYLPNPIHLNLNGLFKSIADRQNCSTVMSERVCGGLKIRTYKYLRHVAFTPFRVILSLKMGNNGILETFHFLQSELLGQTCRVLFAGTPLRRRAGSGASTRS